MWPYCPTTVALLCIPVTAVHDEFSGNWCTFVPTFCILLVWYSMVQYTFGYDPDDAFGYLYQYMR